MNGQINLSPLGTAREIVADASLPPSLDIATASAQNLLNWYRMIREPLKAFYNMEDEVALIAWELARWQDGLGPIEQEAVMLLILTVLVHLREGSTRILLRGDAGRVRRLDLAERLLKGIEPLPPTVSVQPAQAVELIETLIDSNRLTAIVGRADEFKPLIVSGPYLYLQKMFYLEGRFVDILRRRVDADIAEYDEARVEQSLWDVLERSGFRNGQAVKLRDEQQSAVRLAVRYPMTIISGGPGTGKTTVVLSILRTLRRLGVTCEQIALAAPTGKAANRMSEAIDVGRNEIVDPSSEDLDLANLSKPRTLHRLLGYSQRTGRFAHHENNRLAERVVIVDEGSMIDLALMERLVRSLRDGSRFVLLGDAHQLPSVEAGAVMRDLLLAVEAGIDAPIRPRGIRLIHSHRMRQDDENGRNILAVAQTIDQGDQPPLTLVKANDHTIVERRSVAELKFLGVEYLPSLDEPKILDEFLDRWLRDMIRSYPDFHDLVQRNYKVVEGNFSEADRGMLRSCFDHWERFRILCLTRVSQTTGSDRVNAALHQRSLDELGLAPQRDNDFMPGEPIMMQVNDYNRGIFNGDQGLVLNVSDGGHPQPMAVFPRTDGMAAFHVDSLRSVLLHSYAMTVHKAQGSEFETVGLILPDQDLPINTREILYTALTRSRRSVVIIGDREILKAGIRRTISRDSGIVEKLRGASH